MWVCIYYIVNRWMLPWGMHGNRGHWDSYIFLISVEFLQIISRQEGGLNRFLRIMTQTLHTALRNQRNGDDTITTIRPHLLHGARHPLPRVRLCAFRARRGFAYHRMTITLMISLMYKIENRWPSVISQLLKVSVNDHTSGKHVNDRLDLLLSHTGIAHAFFIYLTFI